jgi:hypothetical protein
MEPTTAYRKNIKELWQSDRYGHPQRTQVGHPELLIPRRALPAPRTDKYGHDPGNDRSQPSVYAVADL